MAERRMFSKPIIDSDAFLDMPLSTQALYFHLSMRADDDGFINNPKKIQKMVGANDNDLDLLIAKSYILHFESGIIVVKHWKMHNYIQKDRYKPTSYTEEKEMLTLKKNKEYSFVDTKCIQDVSSLDTQVRLGKVRLGKDSIDKEYIVEQSPTVYPYIDVIAYLNQASGKKFKHTSDKTKGFIKARVNEGFTLDDFKRVIDTKVAEWGTNPDMKKYIRPETLFGNKFEGYLNQEPQEGETNGQTGKGNAENETDDSAVGRFLRGEVIT